ncbi:hypothetical protein Thimo_2125 [Thioflavicoccus mobilis 8321]|uniref:Uncharacterized protein n=1 Tax=Thioflavicoccus mobilis 8321 TaxID=765912 RepID=L0GY32_9GAMM|nr:hypothetical protein [Thioflavicoccus mobilis]AGA90876.1 hypothetical protein Thimo_2125 [Thioflavicoccus mobilis 8321]
MLGQLLLTIAVVLVAYLVIRGRKAEAPEPPRKAIPPRLARAAGRALLGLAALGVAYFLIDHWSQAREAVTVQVINANTGRITYFQARRGDVKGRTFVTLDGQRVMLADVERMVLRDADAPLPPQPGSE